MNELQIREILGRYDKYDLVKNNIKCFAQIRNKTETIKQIQHLNICIF